MVIMLFVAPLLAQESGKPLQVGQVLGLLRLQLGVIFQRELVDVAQRFSLQAVAGQHKNQCET